METEKWVKEADTAVNVKDTILVVLMGLSMFVLLPVMLVHNLWNIIKKKAY
jgi:hypothetical protein